MLLPLASVTEQRHSWSQECFRTGVLRPPLKQTQAHGEHCSYSAVIHFILFPAGGCIFPLLPQAVCDKSSGQKKAPVAVSWWQQLLSVKKNTCAKCRPSLALLPLNIAATSEASDWRKRAASQGWWWSRRLKKGQWRLWVPDGHHQASGPNSAPACLPASGFLSGKTIPSLLKLLFVSLLLLAARAIPKCWAAHSWQ